MYRYNCNIIRVIDGDTVVADIDLGFDIHHIHTVRLLGINTPELNKSDQRERARAAKDFLAETVLEERCEIQTHKDRSDKYGRYLAEIIVWQDDVGVNVNELLVTKGFAVTMKE